MQRRRDMDRTRGTRGLAALLLLSGHLAFEAPLFDTDVGFEGTDGEIQALDTQADLAANATEHRSGNAAKK